MPLPERKLIERIRAGMPRKAGPLTHGIGDDCAVLHPLPGCDLLVTTDLCIEDVHFRLKWHPARSVGHRSLARGLSDIAAMGGDPVACFLSLGLPPRLPQSWVNGFLDGLERLARRFRVPLAGGDVSTAPKILADVAVLGHLPEGTSVLRSGARPGDRIYVTGELGESAAVLRLLYTGKSVRSAASVGHFYPEPRIEIARWLRARGLATAMIDLSDGLSTDLTHICEESGTSAMIFSASLPLAKDADLELALHGGEDYELLFAASPKTKVPPSIAGVKVTEIGMMKRRKDYRAAILIFGDNGKARVLPPSGWQHLSRKPGTRREGRNQFKLRS